MTAYNVVNPAALAAGQPEDISVVLANFNAIASILNGGLDNTNLNAAAGIVASKLAGYPSDGTKALLGDGTWGTVVSNTVTLNSQTASYTAVLSDAGKLIMLTVASANTFTIPSNANVPFAIGTVLNLVQYGAGQTTVAVQGGVGIAYTPGLKIGAQYGMAQAVKVGTDQWLLAGNLVP